MIYHCLGALSSQSPTCHIYKATQVSHQAGIDKYNAIYFSSLQFYLFLFDQIHWVFLFLFYLDLTLQVQELFCLLPTRLPILSPSLSESGVLPVPFFCSLYLLRTSALVAGGGGVDVPWLPYTLLSFCLVLIHGHPKLLTLTLCPHSDSTFGWLQCHSALFTMKIVRNLMEWIYF